MKTFEEVKEELLRRAKEEGACEKGYRMGLKAENKADLLKAVTANWWWVFVSAKIIDTEYLKENFTEEELNETGIYISGFHTTNTVAFALGSATVRACDRATVEAYGSATVKACDRATVKAYDIATVEACDRATVEAYGSATVKAYDRATVKAYDRATVEAYGSATVEACDRATVEAFGSATVKAYGSATVEACDSATVEAYGSATVKAYESATVKACDRATVEAYGSATVEACDNTYVEDFTNKIRPSGNFVIVKDYYNEKIYVKKGKFEIIEVE